MLPPPSDQLFIGIVGSRRRSSLKDRQIVFDIINHAIVAFPDKEVVIVSGGAKFGADHFAKEFHELYGQPYREHAVPTEPPVKSKWEFTQRAYARNLLIATDADILFALVHADRKGGTENTVAHAEYLGKTYFLVDEDGRSYLRGVGWNDRNETETDKT